MVRKDINLYARYNKPIGVVSTGGKLSKMGIIMIVVSLIVVLALGGITAYFMVSKTGIQTELDKENASLAQLQENEAQLNSTTEACKKIQALVEGPTYGIVNYIKNSPQSSPIVLNAIMDRTFNIETDSDFIKIKELVYAVNPETNKGEFLMTVEVATKTDREALAFFIGYQAKLEEEIKNKDGKIVAKLNVDPQRRSGNTATFVMQIETPEIEQGGNE